MKKFRVRTGIEVDKISAEFYFEKQKAVAYFFILKYTDYIKTATENKNAPDCNIRKYYIAVLTQFYNFIYYINIFVSISVSIILYLILYIIARQYVQLLEEFVTVCVGLRKVKFGDEISVIQ